ncbi:PH domain-containing protein [Buchananella felis]|uniref:PH domain-containing protein n=1 Tax=Buchananella felis TaxID=3231492 RepID=UPI003528E411
MEPAAVVEWTLIEECPFPKDLPEILIEGEVPVRAFKTLRDAAVFTNLRLIVRDSQGITGKKVEMYSLPYRSINMWSSETAGFLGANTEMELWTRAGQIKLKLGDRVNVRELDLLISRVALIP